MIPQKYRDRLAYLIMMQEESFRMRKSRENSESLKSMPECLSGARLGKSGVTLGQQGGMSGEKPLEKGF